MKKLLLAFLIIGSGLMAEDISTYLYGKLVSVSEVKANLAKTGLKAIGEYDAMGNSDYHVVVYTSNELKNMSSKENRGFSAVQKVLIDKKDRRLVFTNPDYFLRAFMQDDLNSNMMKITTNRLNSSFSGLEKAKETVDADDLADYRFMFAMPYYEDMIEVANGTNLANILEENAKEKIVFKVSLKDSTLYGVSMDTDNGEKSYIPAIAQEKNSAFLPYMVLVKKEKAFILHPKYYLAVSLPKLSMGEFMTISDAPGNIEEFFKGLFIK